MPCQSRSRRRIVPRRLPRRLPRPRAGDVRSCLDAKLKCTCKRPNQSSCTPSKSRPESNPSTTNLAARYDRGQQCSVTALTDSSGTIKERYAYDAYGRLSVFDGSGTARMSSSEGNRFAYTGREWDEELGLYHYRTRMYDSQCGQFLGRDPIGYVDGFSLYNNYSGISKMDPSGRKVEGSVGCDLTRPINEPLKPKGIKTKKCYLPCVIEHEKSHIKDLTPCCKRMRAAYQRAATPGEKRRIRDDLALFMDSWRHYTECKAYRNDLRCLSDLRYDKGCPCPKDGDYSCCEDINDYNWSAYDKVKCHCPKVRRGIPCPY